MDGNRLLMLSSLIIVLIYYPICASFTPKTNNYGAYGVQIALNDILLVEAQNSNYPPGFLIQFAPYNNSESSLSCTISYPDTTYNYVYAVGISKNQTQFLFIGEQINGGNGTFIGLAQYNQTATTCENSFAYSVQYFTDYEHQEYYILGIEPRGHLAYGFANQFICILDTQNSSNFQLWNGNLTWPDHSFMPHAVDLSDNFGVIAGFIRNPIEGLTKYIPTIYLLNFNSSNNQRPVVVNEYRPNATNSTWQDLLTNSDAEVYSAKYDMSVSISPNGGVLVGMQFINRVFLFSVNTRQPTRLNYVSRNTNGRSIGNGKSVAWLDGGIAAILVNSYSLTYQWTSSQIYFYDIQNYGYNSSSTPLSAFPNSHQVLPASFSSVFLNLVASQSSLALLDDTGNILIFNSAPAGFFPAIQDTGLSPIFTSPQRCLPGTYKNRTGINDCILCPFGTRNSGNSSQECIPCSPESFCSLGSVNDVPQSALQTIVQIVPYPKSPESTIFDEILIQNMFHIGSGRCLVHSPLFWVLLVAGLGIIVIILMATLQFCVTHPRSKQVRHRFKWFLKHIDLIGEGELWIGGLASLCLIVLVSFAYSFSNQFLGQYPIETTFDSHFACDPSLRNAKFQADLQSLSIPVPKMEQKMFDLLNNQIFYLNVDFINTFINCDAISLQALFGTKWSSIRWLTCVNSESILSLSIPLPYQHISVQILLSNTQTIGALRIGLRADGHEDEHYKLNELHFYQSFSKPGQILAHSVPVTLDITKVINETVDMHEEESDFTGIYIPTFTADINSLFLTQDQYVRSTESAITLMVNVRETSYYVKNSQQPIAKQSEVIFHNLLFTIVCLEIFVLLLILYKLFLKPLCRYLLSKRFFKKKENVYRANDGAQSDYVSSTF